MKTERNIITIDEYGRIHLPSTTNNDIWMNTNELIELFGIKYSILRGNIRQLCYPFLFLEGRIPPSKKQQFYICHRPVGLLSCRLYGRHTCGLYSFIAHKLDNRHIAYLCYGSPNYKPRFETLDLCSSGHSKVCFQPFQMN